ncbi:temperature dependent protein affecting M2 dsRNA replication [Radiomyces spectabilis]|uniref:temperature dependent protein affecting M2 dsRNA replication n=1 Tax=Radiomyces spectabilis TaxID=64574 RepID=UPI0022201BBF|nr:temperature dependent protein affecting M2 dsRNA replication [Radiomyces spectabilis]KAI8374336.1 temperature dependent protein affecting M2 dsRNA replication [Radiomyces spectabilis]
MLTLSFFLNGLVKKERNDYFEIADNLPFMTDINVALGLVVKHYLEQTLDNGVDAMDSTEKTFPSCTEIKADMQKGFQFWDSVMAGVKTLKEAKSISEVTYTMFVEADNWLQPKKP